MKLRPLHDRGHHVGVLDEPTARRKKDARLGALTMHSGICCQEYRAIPYENCE